jgi:lipopolysaccharide biosynthesis glycosyltransferase
MKIKFVTKTDYKFFSGLQGLLGSLKMFYPNADISVFDYGLTSAQIEKIKILGANIITPRRIFKARPETLLGTPYTAAIFSLMSFDKVDTDILIHLDSDVVICGSLDNFLEQAKKYEFVGVCDYPPLTLRETIGTYKDIKETLMNYNITNNDLETYSFNAGVFSINMSIYNLILSEMEKIYKSELVLPFRDQTMLNIALLSKKVSIAEPLPIHYNFRHFFRRASHLDWSTVQKKITHKQPLPEYWYENQQIRIVHFIGEKKPWETSFDKKHPSYILWKLSCDYFNRLTGSNYE